MYNVIYTDPITLATVTQRNVESTRVARFIGVLISDVKAQNIHIECVRQYDVGEWAVIRQDGELVQIERHMTEYSDQRWYWVRRKNPDPSAIACDEFPHNGTHYACMESELEPAQGDDFANPPTVGNEVI